MQADTILLVPCERIENDFGCLLRPVEHRGQHDAVVVAERLGAEHRDIEQLGAAARENLLDGARARHAVADDDQIALCCSSARISTKPRSIITFAASPSGAAITSSIMLPGRMSSMIASGT